MTAHPPGRPWYALFGPGPGPADPLTAATALTAAADAGTALAILHSHGASHRALHPGALFVDGPRCRPRDAGLAFIPPIAGEGGASADGSGAAAWQAPEQRRSPHATGPATDVYRLAAIVYHTLTGRPPTSSGAPPIRAALPGFPGDTDRALLRAVDADPGRRPGIGELTAALRDGARGLSLGGGT